MAIRRITIATRDVKTIVGQLGQIGDADGVGLAGQISGATHLASDGKSVFISDGDVAYEKWANKVAPTIRQMDVASLSLTTMVGTRGLWTIQNGTGAAALVHQPGPITFDSATHSLVFFDAVEGVFQKIH
jgi:hypothetical protein